MLLEDGGAADLSSFEKGSPQDPPGGSEPPVFSNQIHDAAVTLSSAREQIWAAWAPWSALVQPSRPLTGTCLGRCRSTSCAATAHKSKPSQSSLLARPGSVLVTLPNGHRRCVEVGVGGWKKSIKVLTWRRGTKVKTAPVRKRKSLKIK